MCFKPNMKVLVFIRCSYFFFILCIIIKLGITNIQTLIQPLIYDDIDLRL
jgi:hypothetical protein